MKKILIITSEKFWNKSMGNEARISEEINFLLSKKSKIYLFYLGVIDSQDRKKLTENFKGIEYVTSSGIKDKVMHNIRKNFLFQHLKKYKNLRNFKGRYFTCKTLEEYYSEKNLKILYKYLNELDVETIMIHYVKYSYFVREDLKKKYKFFIDTHDIQSERYLNLKADSIYSDLKISFEEEMQELNKFDKIIAINERDQNRLAEHLDKEKIILLPYGIKHKYLFPKLKGKLKFGYVAASGEVNKKSMEKFIKEVWKNLPKDNIELNIYGSICNDLMIDESSINLKGYVENLEDIYGENHIFVNPVLNGSGLKIKNVEALCYGNILFTTSIGAQGIEEGIGKYFFVNDTSEKMLENMEKLIRMPEKELEKISLKSYDYAEEKFNIKKNLENFYSEL